MMNRCGYPFFATGEAWEHPSHAQAARLHSTQCRSPAEIEASVPRKVAGRKSVLRVEYVPARTVVFRVSPERSTRNVTLAGRGSKAHHVGWSWPSGQRLSRYKY